MKREAMWIWLSLRCGVASKEALRIVEGFDSIEQIYDADYDTYCDHGVSERLCEDLCDKSLDEANRIIEFCQSVRAGILCYDDVRYPNNLRTIKDPPIVLYYTGILPDFNKRLFVSIVGTRKMSEYGMRAAYKIAYEIASAGAVVVSGMALGIDAVSAAAAIASKGKTVAVLGCGIDKIYPKEHRSLRDKIRQNGVVLTEFAPSTPPKGSNFPIRNRIISGLSQATVVIEADATSGAMITAKTAILQGRDIYAVPSNIDGVNSAGTNSLIRDGAQAVLCGRDVIKHYTFAQGYKPDLKRLSEAEERSAFDLSVLIDMGIGSTGDKVTVARSQDDEREANVVKKPEQKTFKRAETSAVKIGAGYADDGEQAIAPTAKKLPDESETQKPRSRDLSREALESLSEKQRRVFDEMPLDLPVTVDYLTKTGMKLGEVISALTVLEVKGLVVSLPGAIYLRK